MEANYNLSLLNKIGYIEIDNFLDESKYNSFKNAVDKIIQSNPDKHIVRTDSSINSKILEGFINDEIVTTFVKDLFEYDKVNYDINDTFKVLRILNGKETGSGNDNYHFDGYYLTLFFPIYVPKTEGNNGSFNIFPNIRPIIDIKLFDFFIKFIFQNKLTKKFYKSSFFKKRFKPIIIEPKEKSVIVFRGFKSLHGSGRMDSFKKRVSLLYHFKKMK